MAAINTSSPSSFNDQPKSTDEVWPTKSEHPLSVLYPPHLCMVCKKPGKRCSACKSVTFCSVEHQKAAWPLHKRVCKALKCCTEDGSINDTSKSKIELANTVVQSLMQVLMFSGKGGDLHPVERLQVAHMPRCIGCGAHPVKEACQDCFQVGFCEHCGKDSEKVKRLHPPSLCKLFNATSAALQIVHREKQGCYELGGGPSPFDPTLTPESVFSKCMAAAEKPAGCSTAVNTAATRGDAFTAYVETTKYWNVLLSEEEEDEAPKELWAEILPGFRALVADTFSWPLTCFSGIMLSSDACRINIQQKLQGADKGRLTIDVVGAEQEALKLPVWEELLHLLRPWGLKHLVVRFIGPTCPIATLQNIEEMDSTENLCRSCQDDDGGHTLRFAWSRKPYQQFEKAATQQPDVCIVYNAGWNSVPLKKEWAPAIEQILSYKSTLTIVTAYDEFESNGDLAMAKEVASGKKDVQEKVTDGYISFSSVHRNPLCSPLYQADLAHDDGKPFTYNFFLFLVEHHD